MCSNFSLPPGAKLIASLKVGDGIALEDGAGYPAVEGFALEIIVAVNGFFALTHTGRRLSCYDGLFVSQTGVHYDHESDYPEPISDEARRLLAEAAQRKAELEAKFHGILADIGEDDLPEGFRQPDPFAGENDWVNDLRKDLL